MLFEVREKLRISEMLKTGGIICHDVLGSWDVPSFMTVAVRSLVSTSEVAEQGGRAVRRDGSFL